ncbi:Vitamin B12 import ATP-binding protein BtuD [Streptomyces sp. enrichment culture]
MSTPAEEHARGLAPADGTAARARGLTKAYGSGETAVIALDSVDVDIARGRFTAVMGPSGSGKSTLMHCLAGLDTVSAGQVWLDDTEITGLKDRELTRLRRDRVGFMFQSFNLIPTLNARENITLPMDIAGQKPDEAWLDQVIDTLGLRDRLKHRPAQLSGGQQQRVACARALASRPELIFADEPTGNLDSRAGLEVLGFLREAVDRLGQTVVMVTHDPGAAAHSDLVLFLADGRIVDEMHRPTAESVLERMKRFDVVRGATVPDEAVPPGGGAPSAAPAAGGTPQTPTDGGTPHPTAPDGGGQTAPPDARKPGAAPSDAEQAATPKDAGRPDAPSQDGGRQGAPHVAGGEPSGAPQGDGVPGATPPGGGTTSGRTRPASPGRDAPGAVPPRAGEQDGTQPGGEG